MWSLYLGGNQITDVKPLAGLKSLDTINLSGNGLVDIAPLAGLTPSKFLFLQGNKITDLAVLVNMAKADAEGEKAQKRFAPFWYVDVSGNPLSDEAKTAQITKLRQIGVADRIKFQ
jgi:internalin A